MLGDVTDMRDMDDEAAESASEKDNPRLLGWTSRLTPGGKLKAGAGGKRAGGGGGGAKQKPKPKNPYRVIQNKAHTL